MFARMLMEHKITVPTYFQSIRMLQRFENGKILATMSENPSFLEILREIGIGILESMKKIAIAKESVECINKGYEVEHFFTNLTKDNFTSTEGLENVVRGTENVIVPLIDECLKAPEDLFRYISASIDFFTHMSTEKFGAVMYEDIKLFADTAIQVFKVVYEKHDVTKATEMIGDLLAKVIQQLSQDEQKKVRTYLRL